MQAVVLLWQTTFTPDTVNLWLACGLVPLVLLLVGGAVYLRWSRRRQQRRYAMRRRRRTTRRAATPADAAGARVAPAAPTESNDEVLRRLLQRHLP